ncbi:LacI family DNA-binding transcriptional regulator [Flindersiella endophytica]
MSFTLRQNAILRAVRRDGSVRVTVVAAELGVSPMTVRRDLAVLAAAGEVERVYGGAELPRPLAARTPALRPVRTQPLSIGMVVPGDTQYYREVIRGAQAAAEAMGARLTVGISYYDETQDRAQVDRLLRNQIDGLLLTPTDPLLKASDDLTWIRRIPVPTVIVERRPEPSTGLDLVDYTASDHERGALLALRHLADLGHRRIGLLASDTPTTSWLVRAFATARAEFGLAADVPFVVDHPQGDFDMVKAFLDLAIEAEVTAVVAHPDPQAAILLQQAVQRQRTVPDDLAIVAYDDDLAALSDVPLTAVAPPRHEVGRTAAARLVHRLREGRSAVPQHILLVPRLNVRASTRPAAEGRYCSA